MEAVPANPFKGLRPYSQRDRDRLFGRDRDMILMKDRIFSGRTTLLFAGSGVGKTSFLNAKIIPELKKQCVVVWHNRWTGADEVSDASDISEERMRWWRPRALIRELVRKFRAYREGGVSVSPVKRAQWEQTNDAFETEVRQTISQNLRRKSGRQPLLLSQVLSRFRKSAQDQNAETNRGILILDQFEEVFQYHAYEDYFGDFVKDLCEVINSDDYQVRVVFSMREEFLGELSVFDNRIPDLFSNYYRLRYPDKDEAEDIIRRTCQLSGVNPDETKLRSLVEDLSKIAKGSGSFAERSSNPGKTAIHVIKRNFVAPPYLQIACERLWTTQYSPDRAKSSLSSASAEAALKTSPSYAPFLIGYQSGNGPGKDGQGGDARRAVVAFCEEKLSSPYLNRNEQDLIARAFSFLVTKQGAKMAYELNSLAEHMGGERVSTLRTALEKLSQDEAKILRESRGPDRAYWFELYHDMYATIVDDWKVRYLKRRRQRYMAKLAVGSVVLVGSVAGLMLFVFALFHWVVYPSFYQSQLEQFRNNINGPEIERQSQYLNAVSAYKGLKETSGNSRTADSLWAHILERRAQWFEATDDPSSALVTLLKAASMESDEAERERLMRAAQLLLGAPNGSLIATYCTDCASASLSPDGKTVLSLNIDGHVRLWDADTGVPLGPPFCAYCSQSRPAARRAMFSSDGKQVLTVGGVAQCNAGDTDAGNGSSVQTGLSIQLWDAATRSPLLPKPLCLTESTTEVAQPASSSIGKESATAKLQDAPPAIDIRAFAKVGKRFWIAGVRGKEIHVWDDEGSERTVGSGRGPASVNVTFTRDGLYLVGLFPNESIKFWRVTESQIVPHPFKSVLALAFGPGHTIVAAEKDNLVSVMDLDSGKALLSINPVANAPTGTQLQNIGFDPTAQQFLTRARADEGDTIQVWRTSTGEPLYKPLKLSGRANRTGLSPDGKTLLVMVEGDPQVIEKWDMQSGRVIGIMKREFTSTTFRPDRNSILTVHGTIARLWAIDANLEGSRVLQGNKIEPYEITPDGKVLLTVGDSRELQFWDAETGAAKGAPISLHAQVRMARISEDGMYAVTATSDNSIRVWYAGKQEPLATFSDSGEPEAMALSKDGKLLARAVSKDVRVWTLATGREIDLKEHTDIINDLTLTGGVMLSGSDDTTARIWDPANGQLLRVLNAGDQVKAVALSSDGSLALTGCNDGSLRLWDVQSGRQVGGEIKVKGPILQVTFSNDGKICAALTPSWIYLSRVDDHGLTYERGSLIADPWEPIFSLLPDSKKIRFAYQLGANAIQLQDLDFNDSKEFGNDPKRALDYWQSKLGVSIGELGQLGKLWQEEPVPDETQQNQQSRKAARY